MLYAVNSNGNLKWSFATEGSALSSPAVDAAGTIYFGGDDCNLYAVYQDGSLKWSYAAGSSIQSSPAIGADGTVYFGSFDLQLHAIGPGAG
jgi:outer membrane protein assembly factor BamB